MRRSGARGGGNGFDVVVGCVLFDDYDGLRVPQQQVWAHPVEELNVQVGCW